MDTDKNLSKESRYFMKSLQIHDPMKELRESIKAFQMQDPMKELRESTKAFQMQDPMKELRESMKALQMQDPMKELRKSITVHQMQDPMKGIRESIKALQMQDPMRDLRESMKALQMQDTLKKLRESMMAVQMQDPMKELRESMKALQMQGPMKELRESMQAFQSLGSLGDLVNGIADERWELVLKGGSEVEIHAGGKLSIESTLVTQVQVQEIAHQVISESNKAEAYQFEQYINTLINEIRSLKDQTLERVLALLIYPIIVGLVLSFVNPVVDYHVKETFKDVEKRQVLKGVSNAITSTVSNKAYLSSFRVVTATSLNVRKLGSSKSDVVGTLYLGDVVEVVEKGRKWSLISWQDSKSDAILRGWVFSRYLKVIK